MNLERSLRGLRWLALLLLGVLLFTSCGGVESSPQAGSETHFLMSCDDAGCADGMQCICGVCSKPCVQQADCADLSEIASCAPLGPRVAEERCDVAQMGSMCDARCLLDADCSALSAESRCDNGYCREPATEPPPPAMTASCMPSNVAPQEVLIAGDVLLELSIFGSELEKLAVDAGSLADGAHYRNSAAGLNSLLATGALSIDSQYSTALADGVPRVIVMDGGATDVLNGNCAGMLTPDCPAAADAVSGAEQLFERFKRDGVEQVVYFFYGDPVDNPSLKDGIDLLRPLLQNVCGKSPVPCHWLDLRPVFKDHPEYVGVDGLVFTDAGATAAAAATFALMQQRCIAN
ncbi:MAG TPA: hypothetical protein VEQ58_08005 [Polyangiaceae bacterium]|nr:hypothetical protein [Polyangiaceae bacterium]